MTNVISLPFRTPPKIKAEPNAALIRSFAQHRKLPDDVYWLKENAELLSIFECTGQKVGAADLIPYMDFYEGVIERISFFPQYYRFLTSITLDLEDLGLVLPGRESTGEALCAFAARTGLAETELSDLQRAEAARILARRGVVLPDTQALTERLHRVIDRPANFAVPNRKAAYELTHIVFYLSEYGRRDPQISQLAQKSLIYTGIVAHLEENADLLAEVCVALRYAGCQPPEAWETWLQSRTREFSYVPNGAQGSDDYHEYLVLNWSTALAGAGSFDGAYISGEMQFNVSAQPVGALRHMSETLYHLEGPRLASWEIMERRVLQSAPPEIAAHLCNVRAATPEFDGFFEIFARQAKPIMGA
jgi:hypothetical protein